MATEKRGRNLLVEDIRKTFIFYLPRISSLLVVVKCGQEVEQSSVSSKAKSGFEYFGKYNFQFCDKKYFFDTINLSFLQVFQFLLTLSNHLVSLKHKGYKISKGTKRIK